MKVTRILALILCISFANAFAGVPIDLAPSEVITLQHKHHFHKKWQYLQISDDDKQPKVGYIKFDFDFIKKAKEIESAVLSIPIRRVQKAGTLNIYSAAYAWDSGTIDHDNHPGAGTWVHSQFFDKEKELQVVEIDVLSFLQAQNFDPSLNTGFYLEGIDGLDMDVLDSPASSKFFESLKYWKSSLKKDPLAPQLSFIFKPIHGPKGEQGEVGPVGPQGVQGETGAVGPQGPIGLTGPQGVQGETGAVGPEGPIGLTGPQGVQGETGAVGAQGPIGLTGAKGDTGATGAQGPVGPAGPKGDAGVAGAQGPAGAQGITGATGAQGPAGPVGPQGPTGATGPAGPKGEDGAGSSGGMVLKGSTQNMGMASTTSSSFANLTGRSVSFTKTESNSSVKVIYDDVMGTSLTAPASVIASWKLTFNGTAMGKQKYIVATQAAGAHLASRTLSWNVSGLPAGSYQVQVQGMVQGATLMLGSPNGLVENSLEVFEIAP